MLNIPESSLRRYAVLFADYLSPSAHKRRRTYTDQDIATLGRIRDLAQRMPLDQIGPLLSVVETHEETANALALVPSIALAIEQAAAQSAQALQRIEQLEALQADQAEELRRLREWLALPWWRRFWGKPPQ